MPSSAVEQVRRRKLVKGVVSGLSQEQAGIAAGYSAKCAKQSASRVLQRPDVRALLERAMKRRHISDDRLMQTLDEGLSATKVISARIVGADATERTDDFVDVPDHPTRHKFLETGLKLKGYLQPTDPLTAGPTQINIIHNYRPHPIVQPPQVDAGP